MSTYIYEHIWPCDPGWNLWRLMVEAKPDLLVRLEELGAAIDGPIRWTRTRPDRLAVQVPVRIGETEPAWLREVPATARQLAGAQRSTLARLRRARPCPWRGRPRARASRVGKRVAGPVDG